MNSAHLHLVTNHVSLFSALFAACALLYAHKTKSAELAKFATGLLLVGAVFGLIAAQTGEGAEDIVKKTIEVGKGVIHEHEEAAEAANVVMWVATALAVARLFAERKFKKYVSKLAILTLLASIAATALYGRAANFGGAIRHTEFSN